MAVSTNARPSKPPYLNQVHEAPYSAPLELDLISDPDTVENVLTDSNPLPGQGAGKAFHEARLLGILQGGVLAVGITASQCEGIEVEVLQARGVTSGEDLDGRPTDDIKRFIENWIDIPQQNAARQKARCGDRG